VERYIDARFEREKYLTMIPVLWGIREARLKELEWERGFVRLVSQRQECPESMVWDAVRWWKFKVKWKRPLMEDDVKALRMIEARNRRQLKEQREN
jgi:hypothetical protein